MSCLVSGRPGPRCLDPSYLAATRLRYQRSSVSGVTIVPSVASADRQTALTFSEADEASWNRCVMQPFASYGCAVA